ncbi:hypothetical protein B296_00046531, partial [Ensete ventricosum]
LTKEKPTNARFISCRAESSPLDSKRKHGHLVPNARSKQRNNATIRCLHRAKPSLVHPPKRDGELGIEEPIPGHADAAVEPVDLAHQTIVDVLSHRCGNLPLFPRHLPRSRDRGFGFGSSLAM